MTPAGRSRLVAAAVKWRINRSNNSLNFLHTHLQSELKRKNEWIFSHKIKQTQKLVYEKNKSEKKQISWDNVYIIISV